MMTSLLCPSLTPAATPAAAAQTDSSTPPVQLARNSLPPTSPPTSSCSSAAITRKRRTPSVVAKKLFHQVISSSSSRSAVATSANCATTATTTSALQLNSATTPQRSDSTNMSAANQRRVIGGGNSGIPSHAAAAARPPRPTLLRAPSEARRRSSTVGACPVRPPIPLQHSAPPTFGRPQASTSGGAVTMTIQLAEPVLYLQGTGQDDYSTRSPAMLRGSLVVRISKATKIKAVTLTFRGKGRTEWPDGIPPKKSDYCEEKDLTRHTWPFFDYRFSTAEIGHCADSYYPKKRGDSLDVSPSSIGSAISHLARSASPVSFGPVTSQAAASRMTLQLSQSRSFSKGESPTGQMLVAQRGYRIFQPGDYVYNFELPVESCLPESIDVDLGSVKYELEGVIERPGAFRPNLVGKKEVVLVRVPSEANLESSEPISISRSWEDQLHYDIVISGKSFPLGSVVPISFKLTPLAKVRCHRIKIFITENIEYSCRNKKYQRVDPTKKVQLLEKRAEGPTTSAFEGSSARVTSGGGFPAEQILASTGVDGTNGSDNLLGDLSGAPNVGPTEMEFSVQLPGCKAKEKDRIHFDTTYGNIQVHHWIKIVMRLSKQDPHDPSKRRHFEISIDSPFHILSCQATHANTTLPAYDSPLPPPALPPGTCSCPEQPKRLSSAAAQRAHPHASSSQRSIRSNGGSVSSTPHLLSRQTSANAPPPPFEADPSPPPLVTPPPRYESVVDGAGAEGLADYFARLAVEGADEESDEEERTGRCTRMLPPLTPGGRVARSMDERRDWLPISP